MQTATDSCLVPCKCGDMRHYKEKMCPQCKAVKRNEKATENQKYTIDDVNALPTRKNFKIKKVPFQSAKWWRHSRNDENVYDVGGNKKCAWGGYNGYGYVCRGEDELYAYIKRDGKLFE